MAVTGADLDRDILHVIQSARKPVKARQIQAALNHAGYAISRRDVNARLYGTLRKRLAVDREYRWTIAGRESTTSKPAISPPRPQPVVSTAPKTQPSRVPARPAASTRSRTSRGGSSGVWMVLAILALLGLCAFSSLNTGSAGSGSGYVQQSTLSGDTNGDGHVVYPEMPAGANPSPEWTGQHTEWNYVEGYYRSDGTYVRGHYRRTK